MPHRALVWTLLVLVGLVPTHAWAGKRSTRRRDRSGAAAKKVNKDRIKRGKTSSVTRRRGEGKPKRRSRRRRDYWPPMKLYHVNTRERLTIRLYDRRGRTIGASVRKLNRFLRCHYTGKRHRMHWRLIQRLYRVSRRFKGRVIRVYSGYRSRKVARSRTSRHTRGRAIDFAVTGVSTRKLRDFILSTYKTRRGLGYYPNTPFVHFDVREKSAFWVDYSGKGEEPRYSTNPFAVLRKERLAQRGNRPAKRVASARTAVEPMGPPAPQVVEPMPVVEPMGPPAPPVIEPMGPPRPPRQIRVKAEGPPPLGPTPGGKLKAAPRPRKRATTKGTRPPSPRPTKDAGDPVSNIRGATS